MSLIEASEAFKQTQAQIEQQFNYEVDRILDEINTAIKNKIDLGDYYTYYFMKNDGKFVTAVESILLKSGYIISKDAVKDSSEIRFHIAWNFPHTEG